MKREPKKTIEATIDIAELAPGGDGVAITAIDGERRAVFVPGVALGERVRAAIDFGSRPARARVLEIVTPSAERVAPACAWVGPCGGCDWMHLSSDAQAAAHAAIVASVLPPNAPEVVVHRAPEPFGYRVRARVHVEAKGKKATVGMFGRRSREPVPVGTCIVLEEPLESARRALADFLDGARGHGEAAISLGSGRLPVIDLRWSDDLPGAVFGRLEKSVNARAIAGARVFSGEVKIPAVIGDPTPWIEGADGAPLKLSPGGFFQASEHGNALLARRVAELARSRRPPTSPAPLLELYAGAGNLTVLLARDFAVTAVESDAAACDAARANLRARSLDGKVTCADAATFPIPSATKLVVLDPPRTGAKDVALALAARAVPAILYVSCDPPTLGRDLATLISAGYALASVETFEMFPQTSHVETVALLTSSRKRS